MRTSVVAALSLSSIALALRAPAAEAPIPTLPVAFAVADVGGAPAQTDAWIDDQLANAEQLFALQGVHFAKVSTRPLDAKHAKMVTRADRDALLTLMKPGVINVFLVESLKDVDEKDRFRSGVHWRPSTNVGKRYVILSGIAAPWVLAHELGHYFGNPHSKVPDNIMSYERTGASVFFDAAQGLRVRASARQSLAAKELVPAKPVTSAASLSPPPSPASR